MKHKKHTIKFDDEKRYESSIESRDYTSSLDGRYNDENDAYKISIRTETSRAKTLLKSLNSKQDLIIIQEILGPPKALQSRD